MQALQFRFAVLAVALFVTAGCGRTGTICETAVDCARGQVCTVDGCVDVRDGGFGGGLGGGGGALGGGGGATGGGIGGGIGGGSPNCRFGETQCPSGCKNLSLDLDNCGRCARPCAEGANATATCSAGTCGLQCAPGFADCDLNPMNGCEANFSNPATCGACRNLCPSGPNASATCSMGVCGLSCAPGFGNCDFFSANGCEADLSAPGNCGTCGNLCRTGANQVATCVLGTCGVQCRAGFGDCDMFPGSGCEANLDSPSTCGSCTNACTLGQLCNNGVCGTGCPAAAVGVLAPNTTVMGTLPVGLARFPLPTCSPESTQYEDLWTFTLTAPSSVVFETGGSLDTVLVLRASCSATTDLGCNDDTQGIGTRSRIIITLQAGTYSLLVKEWAANGSGGPYSLSATIGSASNAVCTAATQLFSGVALFNQNSANGGAPSAACIPAAGGQLFYRVDLNPNERAAITLTPVGMANMTMRLLSSCTATSCISFVQGSTPQVLTFDNRTMGPQSVIVSVSDNTGMNGLYDIRADLGPIPTGSNVICSSATPLAVGGMPITGEAIDLGGPPLSLCVPSQAGRVRYYSVTVPGRGAVTVTGVPNGFNLGLRVLTTCGTATCAAFADGTPAGIAENVRITNPANFAQTYIVAVSSSLVGSNGTYSIFAAPSNPPPALNAFCDAATALPSGIAIAGELALPGGLPLTNLCLPTQSGYVRYYSVTVPPTATLHAVASPGGGLGVDVGLRVFPGCSPASCTGASDVSLSSSSFSGGEAVVLTNLTAQSQSFTLAVSAVSTSAPANGQFSILANVSPTANNAFCAGAQGVLVGQTLPGESLAGAGAPSTACLPTATGLTRYYRVNVAAGERINVTGTPVNFDLSLRAQDGCSNAMCVASADVTPGNTSPERLTLQNDTGTARAYVISVSAPGATTSGTFSLSIVRTGYSMTAIAASCDDLSSAPDLLGQGTLPAISDDAVTPVLQLPPGFAFPFFRMPVSHYAVTMNGFAQLFTAGIGMGNNSFSNTALPTAFAPNGMIAPFWDDLTPIIGQTHVRAAERGAAPNRVFTLQWFDATFLTGGPERLRFQAKLFETTGVIEFHYCELQLNGGSMDDLTGATSTIGLENAFGTEAVQKSFNTPNSISSGSGLRFVPQ